MAVTQRPSISGIVSHALVEKGDDHVVSSLLSNSGATIEAETFEAVAVRAQTSTVLQEPLINRSDVPVGLLNELYTSVEKSLRAGNPAQDRRCGARRDRARLQEEPQGAEQGLWRHAGRHGRGGEADRPDGPRPDPASAVTGDHAARRSGSRTAFKLALARLTDVEFDLVQRVIEGKDLDTLALLCRGANFNRPLFVSLAIASRGQTGRSAAPKSSAISMRPCRWKLPNARCASGRSARPPDILSETPRTTFRKPILSIKLPGERA